MDNTITDYKQASLDYQRIEGAIRYLEASYQHQPSLGEIAASLHMSEYHFQRLFTRWVGISPKRFLQYLTKEHAKELLENSANLLEVAYETGLSGPGRLHDLFITCEGVTPGEFKNRGEGLAIDYGIHATPFGECLLALTDRGICNLIFVQEGDREAALAILKNEWKNATLRDNPSKTSPLVKQVLELSTKGIPSPLSLYLRGTNFQIKVWEALLVIPPGSVVAYDDIAHYIGRPTAARAVSNAVAHNPIPVLIPCHRVIRKEGDFGGYRYGSARKKAMLGWEMARQETTTNYNLGASV
ncbi:MAG: methylated-DNA--[protein]-cysteine S-methyltransferase [Anaerolineales bacterium]|nr:methylated-DNA--[protein]-cysteine S-methyltransferase [Anaerolineales bacterium]